MDANAYIEDVDDSWDYAEAINAIPPRLVEDEPRGGSILPSVALSFGRGLFQKTRVISFRAGGGKAYEQRG